MKELTIPNHIEGLGGLSGYQVIEADGSMHEFAAWVSALTLESKTMLPKTVDEVLTMFDEGRSVMILSDDGTPIAHAAITFLYEEAHVLEVGGVIVATEMRRRGYGLLAAFAASELASEKYPGWTKMALCNLASLPIFLRIGGLIVDHQSLAMIPEAAWEACLTCPSYPETKAAGKICCDTPVIIP